KTNPSPASTGDTTSTDNELRYINPLVVQPAQFIVIVGAVSGSYEIATREGAPVPTADVELTAAFAPGSPNPERAAKSGVQLSTTTPMIPDKGTTTGAITVNGDGDPPDAPDTPVVIVHTVTSADPNYDGLVVPTATVRLFGASAYIAITKKAYVDVGTPDVDHPEQIVATGHLAARGSRLTENQLVCWVYTVTNISDETLFPTGLHNIDVTDTDTRLGPNKDGKVGTIATLGPGDSASVAACAPLIPGDTTSGGGG
ncbi:MAG: hypothetical protein FWD11_07925, partial [Micrococcales bacterium]|nr:hypothetical protein [Micrococcales bacterium]